MINIDKDIYYCDPNESLNLLKNIDYSKFEYPDDITNFHIYSEIKSEKELLCVKSWIATQCLDKCSLTIWSDYDISDNELLKPYLKYVNLKVYDPLIEAVGTPLEGNFKHLNANDRNHWLKSDLFRILITHKYGGIFSDMDVVYLRDFKPLLDQEFVYQWGAETDFVNRGACATFLSVFKNSHFSNILIKEISTTDITPNSTNWGKGLLGDVYKDYKFDILPCAFFDIEWQLNNSYVDGSIIYDHSGLGTQTEKGWFSKTDRSNDLYLECFAWHWHNSSYKNTNFEEGSKFWILNKLIDDKLKIKIG